METVASQCMRRCRSRQHATAIGASILRGTEEEAVAYMRWLCSNCAHVTDSSGRTALHWAASKGHRSVAEWLVKQRDAVLNARDFESGYTPLHRSVLYGQIHVAVSLIKMGANVGALDKEDLTPLGHAMKSRLPIVEFSRANPSEVYVWGNNTNFNLGIGNQQSRVVPELLDFFRRSNISIKQVALEMFHSLFVTSSGRVYSCGHGEGGRLGQDRKNASLVPQSVKFPAAEVCVQACAGSDHTVLLMESGSVWTCGSNTRHQLGHNPPPKELYAPRSLPNKVLPGKVLGVCAGRFHTVLWSKNGISTCGLNAGQLGHPKGDATIIIPKLVQGQVLLQALSQQNGGEITHVAASDAATVLVTKKGNIFVLHEYRCRTIASRMLHVAQVVVSGGRLDADLENSNDELRVCVLTTSGQIMLWQQSRQQLMPCLLQLKRLLVITDVAITHQQLLFTTQDGEAFEAFIQPRKKSVEGLNTNQTKGSHDNVEDWENLRVKLLPNVHRAVRISCDPRGRNFAVIQTHPKSALLEVPQMETSNMQEQMSTLLKEACEEDAIHDIIFEVGSHRFAAHRCIIGSRSEVLAQLIAKSYAEAAAAQAEHPPANEDDLYYLEDEGEETPVVKLANLTPEIFEQILQFIYTNQCDLLIPGQCKIQFIQEKKKNMPKKKKQGSEANDLTDKSAFEFYTSANPKGKGKVEGKNKNKGLSVNDPLRVVAAAARQLGLPTLSKALDGVQYKNGVIELRNHHDVYRPPPVCFDRTLMAPLCDVSVVSLEGKEIVAHRSILAARLEYFHNMFAHGWAEASKSSKLTMALPSNVLEVLLHFLYCDEAPQVEGDPELARALLVVADQLLVSRLKEACECALSASITLRNASELLQLAATYNAPQLQTCCMQFVSLNLSAFLEARSLEEVEWTVLEELSRYHKELTPALWRRTLGAASSIPEPTREQLQDILASFPVPFEDWDDRRNDVSDLKKAAKIKKRHRIRRISSGDGRYSGGRTRKESVSSNASDCSEDFEMSPGIVATELDVQEEEEDVSSIDASPVTPPVEAPKIPAPASLPATLVSPIKAPVTAPVKIPDVKLEAQRRQWNSMFPDLTTALAAVDLSPDLTKPKTMECKKLEKPVKMSQKQRKRLASEPQVTENIAIKAPPVRPAWGGATAGSSVVRGLSDIMRDEVSKQVPHLSTPPKPIPKPVSLPNSSKAAPGSPGQQQQQAWTSPNSSIVRPGPSSANLPSLEAIQADELQQRDNLRRVCAKPLHLTQIEDLAIQELRAFYNAEKLTGERITIQRVESGTLATPTWVSNHRK